MENTEASTTMADAESVVLVFKDEAGSYFLLPQETLAQGRVPEVQKDEVERLLVGREDVQGFLWPFVAGIVVGVGAVAVGVGIGKATKDEGGTMTNAQFVQQVIDQGRR